MKTEKILVIGGYGNVGKIISTTLANHFPGQVIAGGRNLEKAAVAIANYSYKSSISPGVFHIEQLFEPVSFFERILGDNVEFTIG